MFDGFGAAAGFVGQMMTNMENKDMFEAGNAFSAEQAAINRAFQADMSSSAYQRAVKDMIAAGLNPMLAYSQGGASSPNGSSASSIAAPRMENAGAAAMQSAQVAAQTTNVKADTDQKNATTRKLDAETRNLDLTGKTIPWQTRIAELESDIKVYQQRAESARDNYSRERAEEELRRTRAEITELEAQARHHRSGSNLQERAGAGAANEEAFQLRYPRYNQDIAPFIPGATGTVNSAAAAARAIRRR